MSPSTNFKLPWRNSWRAWLATAATLATADRMLLLTSKSKMRSSGSSPAANAVISCSFSVVEDSEIALREATQYAPVLVEDTCIYMNKGNVSTKGWHVLRDQGCGGQDEKDPRMHLQADYSAAPPAVIPDQAD